MATYDKHGAIGSMTLNRDWTEDSQGVNEYYNNCADLKADPNNDKFVILTIKDGKHDFRKGRKNSEYSYRIAVDDLIAFGKKKGALL